MIVIRRKNTLPSFISYFSKAKFACSILIIFWNVSQLFQYNSLKSDREKSVCAVRDVVGVWTDSNVLGEKV